MSAPLSGAEAAAILLRLFGAEGAENVRAASDVLEKIAAELRACNDLSIAEIGAAVALLYGRMHREFPEHRAKFDAAFAAIRNCRFRNAAGEFVETKESKAS